VRRPLNKSAQAIPSQRRANSTPTGIPSLLAHIPSLRPRAIATRLTRRTHSPGHVHRHSSLAIDRRLLYVGDSPCEDATIRLLLTNLDPCFTIPPLLHAHHGFGAAP
jgi:hypothetical protein